MADAYPVTQPRTFGGYELSDNPARMGDIERGFFATAWDNARAYWELETMERWRALFEDAPEISQDEFDEMVGDRPIEKRPFQTVAETERDRKSTRLNSSHVAISYAVFCLKIKN